MLYEEPSNKQNFPRRKMDLNTELVFAVQLLSCVWLSATPGTAARRALLELAQTHVQCVGDAVQPSHLVSSPSATAS